ncbi:MAG: response regulator [Candidatus Thorarchaeota archaeon]
MTMEKKVEDKEKKIYKILIVDDEVEELKALFLTLEHAKQFRSNITVCDDPIKALEKLQENDYDLVLSDFKMPHINGVELLNKVKQKYPKVIRMLITAYSEFQVAKEAINEAEVHSFIEKPWYNDELRNIIHKALKRKEIIDNNASKEVKSVNDALNVLHAAQGAMSQSHLDKDLERKVILEFSSRIEFNDFFNKIKNMKNIVVDDIHIFEDKYILELDL